MLTDCDDVTLETAWEISANHTLRIGGSGMRAVTIANDLDSLICYVYISASTSTSWGDDQLGHKEVLPANRSRIFFVPAGTYDLKATDCNANTLAEQYNVVIQQDITWYPSRHR